MENLRPFLATRTATSHATTVAAAAMVAVSAVALSVAGGILLVAGGVRLAGVGGGNPLPEEHGFPHVVAVDDNYVGFFPTSLLPETRGELLPMNVYAVKVRNAEEALVSMPHAVATADFNGDALVDFAVTNRYGSTFDVFLRQREGAGPYEFRNESFTVPGDIHFVAIAAGDFTNDGYPDVVLAGGDGSLLLYRNDPQQPGHAFTDSGAHWAVGYPQTLAVGDVNQDNALDFLVADGKAGQPPLVVFYGTGTGSFRREAVNLPLPGLPPTRIAVADMTLDGLPDVVIDSSGRSAVNPSALVVAINRGGAFRPTDSLAVPFTLVPGSDAADEIVAFTIGEITGDTFPDFVIAVRQAQTGQLVALQALGIPDPAEPDPGSIYTMLNPQNLDTVLLPPDAVFPIVWDLQVADFSGDGFLDLSLSYTDVESDSGVAVLANDGSGQFIFSSRREFPRPIFAGSYRTTHALLFENVRLAGWCDETADPAVACNDGVGCTEDVCVGGQCQHTPLEVRCTGWGNECSAGVCHPSLGCQAIPANEGLPCAVESFCRIDGVCLGGLCQTTPRDCEDGISCTDDTCNEQMQRCAHRPSAQKCFGTPACRISECVPDDPRANQYGCIERNAPEGTPCDDGKFCTLHDACLFGGRCTSSVPRRCDDARACSTDTCDESLDACAWEAVACTFACNDERDNDRDGRIDLEDQQCEVPEADDEAVRWSTGFTKFFPGTYYQVAAGNFDADALLEVVAVGTSLRNYQTYLYFLDGDGSLLRTVSFLRSGDGVRNAPATLMSPMVADLDGDGLEEVVIGTLASEGEVAIHVVRSDGQIFNSRLLTVRLGQLDIRIGDTDTATPGKEVLVGAGGRLFLLDQQLRLRWSVDMGLPFQGGSTPILAELDPTSEGQEVAIAVDDQLRIYHPDLHTVRLSAPVELWDRLNAVGDIDRDGDLDLVGMTGGGERLAVVRVDSLTAIQPVTAISIPEDLHQSLTEIALGDVNGDQRLDIVAAYNTFRITPFAAQVSGVVGVAAWDAAGKLLWRNDLFQATLAVPMFELIPRPVLISGVVVADFDGDGASEVAVGIGSGDDAMLPRLVVLGGDGREYFSFQQRDIEQGSIFAPWLVEPVAVGAFGGGDDRVGLLAVFHDVTSVKRSAIYNLDLPKLLVPGSPQPAWRMVGGGSLQHRRAGSCDDDLDCRVGQSRPEGVCVVQACQYGQSDRPFRRGDSDGNEQINLTDAIFTLNGLFLGGPQPACQDAADADDNGRVNITDAIFSLNYLFLGSNLPPPLPGPTVKGSDPTEDGLGCAAYEAP